MRFQHFEPDGHPGHRQRLRLAVFNLAPDRMVSLFGYQLADTTVQAGTLPLPSSLAGAAIGVTDSAGVTRLAGLSWVSPSRVEFVMPSGIAPGSAIVTLTNAGTALVVGPIQVAIAPVAPGLFPAAQIVRVHTDGKQTLESVSAGTIAMGSEPIYLRLYATGLRNRSDEKNVSCQIGGQSVPVTYRRPATAIPRPRPGGRSVASEPASSRSRLHRSAGRYLWSRL